MKIILGLLVCVVSCLHAAEVERAIALRGNLTQVSYNPNKIPAGAEPAFELPLSSDNLSGDGSDDEGSVIALKQSMTTTHFPRSHSFGKDLWTGVSDKDRGNIAKLAAHAQKLKRQITPVHGAGAGSDSEED